MLIYQGSGGIAAPYTLRFQPAPAFKIQIQAYIDYLNTLNPAITAITIQFRLHDAGTGAVPVVGQQVGSNYWATWNAPNGNGNPTPAVNFFNLGPESMQVNRWYRVHTGIYLEGGNQFFPKKCADNEVDVRIQVQRTAKTGAGIRVLQIRKPDGRMIEKQLPAPKK